MVFSRFSRLRAEMKLLVLVFCPIVYQSCTSGADAASGGTGAVTDGTNKLNDTILVKTRMCRPENFNFTVQSYGKLQRFGGGLYACVGVLESEFRYIKIRQPATIKVLGAADEISGWVSDIHPYVDDNGMVGIRIKLDSQQGLLPGMNVVASIRNSIPGRLIVPREAVVVHGDSTVVFTMTEKKSVWKYVALGEDNGREVEILRGLTAGDKVIISNNIQLTQDSPVKEW